MELYKQKNIILLDFCEQQRNFKSRTWLRPLNIVRVSWFFYILIVNDHLCTLCGTRPKQYPLISKLPCFLARQWPRNRVSITSGSLPIGAIRQASASFWPAYLAFICGLSKASFSELPPEKPCISLFPGYGRPGTYPVLRCRDSTALSLCRTPQRAPFLPRLQQLLLGSSPWQVTAMWRPLDTLPNG